MQAELWKDIPGFEGFYQASTLGRVRSLDRVVKDSIGRTYNLLGCILKQSLTDKGYPYVALGMRNKCKRYKVHFLVAITFIGSRPSLEHEVNHMDGDKTNNKLMNLEWETPQGNLKHGHKIGLYNNAYLKGEKNGRHKLTEAIVRECRRLRADGITFKELAKKHGVSTTTMQHAVNGKNWRDVC